MAGIDDELPFVERACTGINAGPKTQAMERMGHIDPCTLCSFDSVSILVFTADTTILQGDNESSIKHRVYSLTQAFR